VWRRVAERGPATPRRRPFLMSAPRRAAGPSSAPHRPSPHGRTRRLPRADR
jgi:hypothetical protein